MISSVTVVVPAHNEVDRIASCLDSILVALAGAPPGVATGVWVVADRCTDGTATVVDRLIGGRPRCGWQESRLVLPIGHLRRLGFRSALGQADRGALYRHWLISTDADTTVPPTWVADHLQHADAGAAAVAGAAVLDSVANLHPLAAARYHRIVALQRRQDQHLGAYAANLGVRADAYVAVGGFRALASGEDADLLARLVAGGYRVDRPAHVQVTTSGRLNGRAQGGVSHLLRRLHDDAMARVHMAGRMAPAPLDAPP